jgi:Cytochrome P460
MAALSKLSSSRPARRAKRASLKACLWFGLLLSSTGCSGDEPAPLAPLFPAEYALSYTQVRDCRLSSEHDLSPIRVLAAPDTVIDYQDRDHGFAPGARLVKEEYDFSDADCSGDIQRWTVMLREAEGSSPDTLDWHWQKVDRARNVVTDNEARCVNCHRTCGVPPIGYLGTCAADGGG